MNLREIKELGITQDFLDLVPDKCVHCDIDLDVNEVLTRYICPNPYCKGKLQGRLVTFASELGIDGVGKSAFIDLVKCSEFQKVSDLFFEENVLKFIIFARDGGYPLLLKALNLLLINLGGIKANLDLESYVRCLGLPYVDDLVLSYATSVELYKCLDTALSLDELKVGVGLTTNNDLEVINVLTSLLGYRQEVESFELLTKKM